MSEATHVETSGGEEDLSKYQGDEGLVLRWLKELSLVKDSKAQSSFEKIGERIKKIYTNSPGMQLYSSSEGGSKANWFNVLWSNTVIMLPSLFSRIPKPVVERMFKDSDPIGRLAALSAERGVDYMVRSQQDQCYSAARFAVLDRCLVGRGQVWPRYDVEFEELKDEQGEPVLDDVGNPIKQIKPMSEKIVIDTLNWLDYFHSTARNPQEIRWHARRVYMTRAELVSRFPDCGKLVELSHDPSDKRKANYTDEEADFLMQAEVFEIQDLTSKQRIWISDGYREKPLDVKPDVLKIDGFFSCPNPLLATIGGDSMYPTPDYVIYQKLADELESVTRQISSTFECIRIVGATSKQFTQDIKNMLGLDNGQLWPIDGWANFVEKGGFKGVIDWFPFEQAAAALPFMIEYQSSLLQQINLITGIPDIAQGSTDPNETAEAQQRKSKWAVVKLSDKQADVQRFWREIFSKIAQIMFEPGLFSDETLFNICGVGQMSPRDQEMWPGALALLRNDRLRTFRVDIETDSTIAIDEEVDVDARMKYMTVIRDLLASLQSVQQFRPELMKPTIESVLFAVRAFRTGRPLEGSWEMAMQQIEDNDAAAAANPQQAPPDPAMMKIQVEADKVQFGREELAFKQQAQMVKDQIEMQKLEIEKIKLMGEGGLKGREQELKEFQAQFEQWARATELGIEKYRVVLDEKEKFLEEQRLAGEQLEKKLESEKPKGGDVHIHNGGGDEEIIIGRGSDGLMRGVKRKVPAVTDGR